MKPCRHCGCFFTPSEWQIAKSDYACRPCERIKQAEWRAKRKENGRPVVSTRMPREYHKKYAETYSKNPEVRAKRAEKAREHSKDPAYELQRKARKAVGKAVRIGELVRMPCEICGDFPTHGHHDDYSRPLDVRWLCPFHHVAHHSKGALQRVVGDREKINADVVKAIRLSNESGVRLAERFGISEGQVSRIRRGLAWKDGSISPRAETKEAS